MATTERVLIAIEQTRQRWQNVPAVVRRLQRYFDVDQVEIAEALGLSRQTMANRLKGAPVLAPWELSGLAAYFGVPEEVLFLDPDEALRWVLDHRIEVEEARVRSRCFLQDRTPLLAIAQ